MTIDLDKNDEHLTISGVNNYALPERSSFKDNNLLEIQKDNSDGYESCHSYSKGTGSFYSSGNRKPNL